MRIAIWTLPVIQLSTETFKKRLSAVLTDRLISISNK